MFYKIIFTGKGSLMINFICKSSQILANMEG